MWKDIATLVRARVQSSEATNNLKVNRKRAVNVFADWLAGKNAEPTSDLDALLSDYTKLVVEPNFTNKKEPEKGLTTLGQLQVAMAEEFINEFRTRTATTHGEEMAKPEETLDEEGQDTEGEEGEEGEEYEDEEEEQEPPRQKAGPVRGVAAQGRRQPVAQRPIIIQTAAPRVARQAVPKAMRRSGLLPREDKIRIYVRGEGGKREIVGEYTRSDIGDMNLRSFLFEYVHPEFGYDDGTTDYEIAEIDARGNETGQVHKETLHPVEGAAAKAPDAFGQVRQAMSLMEELKSSVGIKEPTANPLMLEAQRKAASGGDMMQLVAMMMLDKMSKPESSSTEALLMKVLDRIDGKERRGEQVTHTPLQDKIVDVAVTKMSQPPPPPPSFIEQATAFASLQNMMGGNKETEAMKMQLAQLAQQNAQLMQMIQQGHTGAVAKPPDGFMESVKQFEQVSTLVKSLAPQVTGSGAAGGGIGDVLKNIITPDLGKVLGNVLAAGLSEKEKAAAKPAAAPAATPAPAQAAPPPRDPRQPPNPAPRAVIEAVNAFNMAQTREVQAPRFVDVLKAMLFANDPFYTAMLQPSINALQVPEQTKETLRVPRRALMLLINDIRPEIASPEFVDSVLAALGSMLGINPPAALVDTAGKWTLDMRGNLIMLGDVAKEVPVAQATPAAPPAPPPPVVMAPLEVPSAALNPTAPPAEPLSPPRELKESKVDPAAVTAEVTEAHVEPVPPSAPILLAEIVHEAVAPEAVVIPAVASRDAQLVAR